nr:immunoglobulin heavy chain junction region [Macaca mulatta]
CAYHEYSNYYYFDIW